MTYIRTIDSVVEVLRNISDLGVKCNLLLGAGCSSSAGIPTANGIVEYIKDNYPSVYNNATTKDYATCMSQLSSGERRGLIKNFVANAHLNMTHIAVAQLLHEGFIHRILTPNFDNLLIRACSLVNEFPPVYDLASYEDFKPHYLPDQCIFYLHGQYTGLKLMNTQDEVNIQANKLTPLFNRLHENSVWLIVGYSGLNDSLFQLLTSVPEFENRLFWVGYNDNQPHEILDSQLLSEQKYAFYIKDYDSDGFFWELTKKLGKFPPTFMAKPFSYLRSLIDDIEPYKPDLSIPPSKATSDVIQQAIESFENNIEFMAEYYYKLGLFDNILEWESQLLKTKKTKNIRLIAGAYDLKGFQNLVEGVRLKSISVLHTAEECYKKAIKLENKTRYRNNLGNCLYNMWRFKEDKDIELLFNGLEEYVSSIILDDKNYIPFRNLFIICLDLLDTMLPDHDFTEIKDDAKKIRNLTNKDNIPYDLLYNWINDVTHFLSEIDYEDNAYGSRLDILLTQVSDKIRIKVIIAPSVAASSEIGL